MATPDSKKINMAPAKNPYKHSAVHLLVGDLCKHESPQVYKNNHLCMWLKGNINYYC